ncbi:PREDICTED: ankyrin repeat, SAM and basic leucine zipper domain-containing protein 1-like [Priapulus caudatus]|uniref:Ankyrin repeat, SAM and basic leucine zipper domain-containing protein 1-like n=1 Tax=Priapulus caudatus TaxID=37621 RepID=A0ABM1F1X4_PRICU|nr:PREDICTED: ankyrin repeat, SAM and basic leucine zipper domain-containing protein 1-like [Priapulus caudatus]
MAACASNKGSERNVFVCVEKLLEKGADVNTFDKHKMTPLMYAARQGWVSIVKMLLDHIANPNLQDVRGWTVLHWAASRGHILTTKAFVEAGADTGSYRARSMAESSRYSLRTRTSTI